MCTPLTCLLIFVGRAVKYTALSNVKKMRELLDDSIDVVGVGGVFSGEGKIPFITCIK
jgi:dihydroorotate dehydrogenase (fumarate)